MELKYFRLIKTIAEEGNIANSSQRLFLTQSALSHQLREMEERLGFKVFYRSRNHWQLTSEGEELYKLANKLLQAIEDGLNSIQQIKEGAKGTLKVGAECQSFFHGLPGFVQKMAVLYPEIKIDLSLGATHQTLSQVLADEMDVAIVTSKPVSEALYSVDIFEDEIMVVMHKEHYLNSHTYLDAGHFADVHLFINSFPMENVSVYEHFLRPNKITPQKISAIPFTEISLEMVNANMGVMCSPLWMLKPFKLSEDLVFKKIGKNGLKRTHYLVVKEERRHLEYYNNFISNFVEDFSNIVC
ncbi:LysR family transcriptional regulator [Fulvivirga sp. M361]|uniref:LysR family transcriptional regulator n=1 Tax=Fulvivirga sp. M361 TaxID=2594266 RepID=UPI001179B78C|nr:LysR family transcriptional regulator [Fulvivirga sp. M361]TRX48051.1 LysR family transcriptional regulator [Fulvivirga sp. M361]